MIYYIDFIPDLISNFQVNISHAIYIYLYIYISPGLLIEINMEMSHFELFHYMRIQLNHVEMLITKRL